MRKKGIHNENLPQAVLLHVGAKKLGAKEAAWMPDTAVRRAGAAHIGKRIVGLAVTTAVMVGGANLLWDAAEHGPISNQGRIEPGVAPTTPSLPPELSGNVEQVSQMPSAEQK